MTEHFTPFRKMFCVNYYSIPNKSVFGIAVAVVVVVWKNMCLVKTVVEIEIE